MKADAAAPREPRRFDQAWHAELFALTVALNEKGLFDWPEWTACLGQQLGADGYKQAVRDNTDAANSDESYYRAWLAALEALLADKGIVQSDNSALMMERPLHSR